jgi:hypothetical protein
MSREFSGEVDTAIEDAMSLITEQTGAPTPRTYYREVGFPGNNYEITFEANDAEIYVLLDLLDRVTDQPMPAGSFVPTARLLSTLIRRVPTDAAIDWLTYDGMISPPDSTLTDDSTTTETAATDDSTTTETAATDDTTTDDTTTDDSTTTETTE